MWVMNSRNKVAANGFMSMPTKFCLLSTFAILIIPAATA